jgi:hypothetical protein
MLEKTESKMEEFSILKPKSKKKEKIFSAEDFALLFMATGIGVIILILIWVFQVSIPSGWTFIS